MLLVLPWRSEARRAGVPSRGREAGDRSQLSEQLLQKLISQTNPQDLPAKLTSAVALQYLDFFLDLDAASLDENLQADPSSFISLLNSIAKNSELGFKLAPKQTTIESHQEGLRTNPEQIGAMSAYGRHEN